MMVTRALPEPGHALGRVPQLELHRLGARRVAVGAGEQCSVNPSSACTSRRR